MSEAQNVQSPKLHALLIGIDYYEPNRVPSGRYGSLNGCVHDVERVEAYLQEAFGNACRITKLTSRFGVDCDPRQLPTYENIVGAMQRLAQETEQGGRVLIHYSGHGGRAATKYPEAKGGKEQLDEALVPMDIGQCEDRYLRDLELAQLISDMVDQDLHVTVVLDSCHSGGATRKAGIAAPRGIGIVDTRARRDLSLVAPREQLMATWRRLQGSTQTRAEGGVSASCGWIPEPKKGYVLLAACRQHEVAWEVSSEELPPGGVFTHWLLDSLRHLGYESSFQQLYDRTVAKVRCELPSQSPQLVGERSVNLLGEEASLRGSARVQTVNILAVDKEQQRVLLDTGTVHGIGRGAQLAVYPAKAVLGVEGESSESGTAKRKAVVEIDWPGATCSWANLPEQTSADEVSQGDQALLLSPGYIRLAGRVQLLTGAQPEPVREALELVRSAAEAEDSGFLELVPEDSIADLQIAVVENQEGRLEYEIRDRGGEPLENIVPSLAADTEGARRLVGRLVHLTKYKHIRELSNPDTLSELRGLLRLELCRWPEGCAEDKRPQQRVPLLSDGGSAEVNVGERLCLWVTNTSNRPLEVTILDLQPDWGISQIYPSSGDGLTFEPGGEEPILLIPSLPNGCQRGTDVLKVFATRGLTSYRWLELPPLGQRSLRKATTRSPRSLLEELQEALAVKEPTTRTMSCPVRTDTEPEWEAASLEVTVVS